MTNKKLPLISSVLLSYAALFIAKVEPLKAEGGYLNSGIGLSSMRNMDIEGFTSDLEFQPGFKGLIGMGYDFDPFRAEINYKQSQVELSKIGGSTGSTDITMSSVMANIFYDFTNDSKFITSLGVGIGSTNIDIDSIGSRGKSPYSEGGSLDIMAYTALLQIGYLLTPKTEVYIEGSYDFHGDFEINNVDFSETEGYSFLIGSRFKF
tara:strand:+ start:1539 stop:2159 length:621 start_codon:yes stop_codon:yes gene_type:complete